MERFAARINSALNSLACGGLKKPVNRRRSVKDDRRASRSSLTNRAVLSGIAIGLRVCRCSRNSASFVRSAADSASREGNFYGTLKVFSLTESKSDSMI